VKGVRFRNHQVVGDILELALRYRDQGADELVFYDIAASPRGALAERKWVRRVARILDIPFCVAGGIRSIAEAEEILHAGADKVSINSAALENPLLIDMLARRFGSQCTVVGIDSRESANGYRAWQLSGDAAAARDSGQEVLHWVREVQERGAGEIVLNCMGRDGTRDGYDISQLQAVRSICRVPLVASGGAGSVAHFTQVFSQTGVDGALAASVFHAGEICIPVLKRALRESGMAVRLNDPEPS
jgi:cyclase